MATETDAQMFQCSNSEPIDTFKTYSYEIKTSEEVTVELGKDAKKFSERHHLRQDKFEYPRLGKDPGLVLIFNQENFDDMNERKGSTRDVNEIVICLQRQGFNIEKDHIMTDGTKDEILQKLKEVSEKDLTEVNCLIVIFLTHGDSFNMLHTREGMMTTNEVWNYFTACKTLRNKPKMFIFQACKGDGFSTTGNSVIDSVCTTPSKIVPHATFSNKFIGPDMLIVYSTIEGKVSFRNTNTGSWFIQELCRNIYSNGKREDVVSLLIRTTKCICGNYFHNQNDVNKKQMPMFVSTLTKKFYLNRNKDRHLLLEMIEHGEKVISDLIKNKKDKN